MAAPLRIDTRQQLGKHNAKNRWFAEHGVETVAVKLDAGDYAYAPSNILIDTKKDVDELSMDCGKDHARFVREIDRAAASGCRLVVLIEQHPEYNDRENLRHWSGYVYQELSPGFRTRGFLLFVHISRWSPVLSLPPSSARTFKLPMVFSRLTRLNGANS